MTSEDIDEPMRLPTAPIALKESRKLHKKTDPSGFKHTNTAGIRELNKQRSTPVDQQRLPVGAKKGGRITPHSITDYQTK